MGGRPVRSERTLPPALALPNMYDARPAGCILLLMQVGAQHFKWVRLLHLSSWRLQRDWSLESRYSGSTGCIQASVHAT